MHAVSTNQIADILHFNDNNKFVSDIKKKCDLFNSYFTNSAGTPLINNSKLPPVFTVHTESLLEPFYFSADHIADTVIKTRSHQSTWT